MTGQGKNLSDSDRTFLFCGAHEVLSDGCVFEEPYKNQSFLLVSNRKKIFGGRQRKKVVT